MQCDASIKAIISKIDEQTHDIVIADLDDETLIVKENKIAVLKERLGEVRNVYYASLESSINLHQALKNTQMEASDSESN